MELSNQSGGGVTKLPPVWVRLLPYFLSAVLFLSGFFAILAPLPLLILAMGGAESSVGMGRPSKGRWLTLMFAVLTNSVIMWSVGGPDILVAYTFLTTLLVFLTLFVNDRVQRSVWSVEKTFVWIWGGVLAAALLIVLVFSIRAGLAPWAWVKQGVRVHLEVFLAGVTPEAKTQLLGELEFDDFLGRFMQELPGSFMVMTFAWVFVNWTTLLRMNVGDIRTRLGLNADFFKGWKAPETLVWPTLAAGALIVFGRGNWAMVGMNAFKVLMAVYAVQGLSILSAIFDLWKLKGGLRSVGFVLVFLLMSPLLLSLGFFDTWFDFRAKFRQA